MSNLSDARDAKNHARDKLGRQVNIRNLKKSGGQQTWEVRQYEAKILHGNLRKKEDADSFGSWNMDQVVAYGQKTATVGIGNCQELTAVACHHLSRKREVSAFHACILAPPADHVFVVLGQDPGDDRRFPMNFSDWSADAAICDPWVDIACMARDYPAAWRDALTRLQSDGGEIQSGEDKGALVKAPVWIAPEEWSEAPMANAKICIASSTTLGNDGGTNKCCYITTAACRSLGLPDDCAELELLRRFRDEVLLRRPEDRGYVARYYSSAPAVVAEIDRLSDRDAIYRRIYECGVRPSVDAIARGDHAAARAIFVRFVDRGWIESLRS